LTAKFIDLIGNTAVYWPFNIAIYHQRSVLDIPNQMKVDYQFSIAHHFPESKFTLT